MTLKGAKCPSAEWSKLPETLIGQHLPTICRSLLLGTKLVLLLLFTASTYICAAVVSVIQITGANTTGHSINHGVMP